MFEKNFFRMCALRVACPGMVFVGLFCFTLCCICVVFSLASRGVSLFLVHEIWNPGFLAACGCVTHNVVTWRLVMAESVWALHCDPHLVRQLAVAVYCCVVVHFSLGCVHQLSSALSSSRHVPSLGKAQSYGMVNRRIKI